MKTAFKKTAFITFIAIYSALAVGVNVMVHTCNGEEETYIAPSTAKDPCACGAESEMALSSMCCKTEIKSVKINDIQLGAVTVSVQPLAVVDQIPVSSDVFLQSKYSASVHYFIDTSPPPKLERYLFNSVFLI